MGRAPQPGGGAGGQAHVPGPPGGACEPGKDRGEPLRGAGGVSGGRSGETPWGSPDFPLGSTLVTEPASRSSPAAHPRWAWCSGDGSSRGPCRRSIRQSATASSSAARIAMMPAPTDAATAADAEPWAPLSR